jgi:hypothetical protein
MFLGATGIYNATSTRVSFSSTTGSFTVLEKGTYAVEFMVLVDGGITGNPGSIQILKNGLPYWTHPLTIVTTPIAIPLLIFLELVSGDTLNFRIDGATVTTIRPGTTANLTRLSVGPTGPVGTGPTGAPSTVTGPTGPSGPTGYVGRDGISGGRIYYLDTAGGTAPQTGTMTLTPNTGATTTVTSTQSGTNDVLLTTFVSDIGSLPSTFIPAGLWVTSVHAYGDKTGIAMYAVLDSVDSDGSSNPVAIASSSASPDGVGTSNDEVFVSYFVPSTTLADTTKRLRIRLYGNFSGAVGSSTLTLEFRDATLAYVRTTIEVLSPTGPTGPTGPITPYIFDGGDPYSVYSVGPAFDCGGVT